MAPLRRMLLLAGKDLRTFVRDRMALLFSLAFPLLFVFGFSLLSFTGSEDPLLEVAVATEEGPGSLSEQIIDGMARNASPSVRRLEPAEARAQVDAGDLPGYILFPAGFSEAVTSGEPTALQVVADPDAADQRALLEGVAGAIAREVGERALTAATAARLAGEAGSAVDPARLAQALASVNEAPGPAPGTVTVRVEQVGAVEPPEPGDTLLPGYLTMFIFFAAGFGGEELIRERENHTLDRLIASGVSGPTILAGKWLGTAGRAVVQAIVLWLAGVLLFGASFGVAPLGSILVTVAMIAASASFALFIAAFAPSLRAADSITVVVSLAFAALGGSWWPLFIMPQWMQALARITPHAWANDAFNRLLLFGADTGDVLLDIGVLFAFAIAFGVAGVARVRLRA